MPKRLLLIGGGHSHVEVIRRWGLAPEPDVAMTLISPDRHTPYSGMLPGYIAGHYSHADCHIDLDAVCTQAGVTRIGASVGAVDFAARIACCSHAPDQPFDVLSIDTGSTPVLAPIPGAERHGIAVKPVAQFLDLWAQLREAAGTAPRPLQVVVVGAGAAGVEVVLAMQHRIAGDGGRARGWHRVQDRSTPAPLQRRRDRWREVSVRPWLSCPQECSLPPCARQCRKSPAAG